MTVADGCEAVDASERFAEVPEEQAASVTSAAAQTGTASARVDMGLLAGSTAGRNGSVRTTASQAGAVRARMPITPSGYG